MLDIDRYLLFCVNQYSRHSWLFDKTAGFIANSNLLKGGVMVTIIWYLWFRPDENQSRNRAHIVITLIGGLVALTVARILALTLPFRLRPLHQDGLPFTLPYGMESNEMEGWSSFPSDHAVLFFALSFGILFISKRWATFALIYSALLVALPRIYLGLHYPFDIVVGALVGIAISMIGNVYFVQNRLIQYALLISSKRPEIFYPTFFLFTFQIAEMFGSVRSLAGAFLKSLSH